MRRYIRHPSDMPIDYRIDELDQTATNRLHDVSMGGLCFIADRFIKRGTRVHISIPLDFSSESTKPGSVSSDEFDGDGTVAWCRKEGLGYVVGVQFADESTQFCVRMVEQVCHIEHYRHDVLVEEGRQLSSEEAAKEWVNLYAAEFPSVS